MDPPRGVLPGEEPPQLVMRPVFCLVRSRAAGQQQYTTLESDQADAWSTSASPTVQRRAPR